MAFTVSGSRAARQACSPAHGVARCSSRGLRASSAASGAWSVAQLAGVRHTARGGAVARAAPTTDLPTDKYDYIIVGGGLAGCLLACRLSADPSKSVLVLEAGENNADPIVKIPAGITRLFKHSELDWNLETKPQEPLEGRATYLARGKLLGGSSSTNATLYHRGTAQDYDAWGIDGWKADDVLPWFKVAEDNSRGSDNYHGVGGAMHVEDPIYQNDKIFGTFFQAARELGMVQNADFNDWSHSQEGYGPFQVAITGKGRRADAYRQMLQPILGRENLTVVTRAQTCRVLTETVDGSPKAVGVEVQSINPGARVTPSGAKRSVYAKTGGEVILCAGAVHTPQILMLSGIGEAKHLKEHGIDVVADLPEVGNNLQDHPAVLSAYTFKDEVGRICITDHIYDDDANIRPLQLLNWALLGKGALSSTACDRGAFVRTSDDAAQPDLQIRCAPGLALNPDGVGSFVDFGKMKKEGKIERWPTGVTFQLIAVRPKSRGSIRLASGKAEDAPAINIGYCTDSAGADRATLRNALKLSRKLANTSAWSSMIKDELHPGADAKTDDDLDAYISKTLHSANAVVGSCALGKVVDAKDFGVKGVSGLRVVDASVLPIIPGGQTGAPTVMVAERAAAAMTQTSPIQGGKPALAAV